MAKIIQNKEQQEQRQQSDLILAAHRNNHKVKQGIKATKTTKPVEQQQQLQIILL